MIGINTTRFGNIEVDESTMITLKRGMLGFPNETSFVLIERGNGSGIGYLQSIHTPWLAFPVMDAAMLAPAYPVPSPAVIAHQAGLGSSQLAMLVVLVTDEHHDHIDVNLLAPVVVDLHTRQGVQVTLDPFRYATRLRLPAGKDDGHEAETAQQPSAAG